MTNDFDFNRVGKRMPYTIPDGFFDQMESNVMKELGNGSVAKTSKRRPLRRIAALAVAVSAAAAVALVFLPSRNASTDFADVEQAFCNLNTEDQAYMLSVYQEDIFINQEND